MSESCTVTMTREESLHISQFLQDQDRARRRVRVLEDTAREHRVHGQVIPAVSAERTARLLRWLWMLDNEVSR